MEKRIRIISITLFLSLSIILTSCRNQKSEWKGSIEKENGVTIVKNPKEPMYGEDVFSLKEELSLGEAKGRKEYMFSQIRNIDVDNEENIYVLDSKEFHIKVFDKDGKYLISIGRPGQGPGEFELPTQIQITSQKEIMVFDLPVRSLSFFSLSGEFLRRTPLTKMPVPALLVIDLNGDFIGRFTLMEERPKGALMKFFSKQEKVLTIAKLDPYGSESYNLIKPTLPFDVTEENNIIWAISSRYEIQIINSEGNLLKKVIKDDDPVEITEEDKKRIIRGIYGRETIPPGRKAELPKYFHPIGSIHIDNEGRIFVRTSKKSKDEKSYYYDVFDPEGRYIAKIILKAMPDTSLIWKRNKLYTIEEDEEGYQVVKRYKVSWKY